MIEHRKGNLLTQSDINVIAHQCNLYHTFGSGIAKEIKQRFPKAYAIDRETPYGYEAYTDQNYNKFGRYSVAEINDNLTIINCYSQRGFGSQDRNTSYDEIYTIFHKLEAIYRNSGKVLGVPKNFGCGLGSGRWHIVNAIFEEIFSNSPLHFVICEL